MSNRKLVLLFSSLLLCIALTANAQQQTARLTGRITDRSGAAIPGATVVVANPARGIRIVVKSDSRGNYVAPLLPPADGYQVTVSRQGFTQTKRDNITLQVAQVAQVNIQLQVGSVNQTVVVTGAPPLLDTQTSSIGQVIGARTISALPLNGRSSFRLIQLTPGVTFNASAYGQFGDVAVNTTWDTNFSISGGQAQSNEILIDGIPSTTGFFDQITTIPSVDDTEEFKVESNSLSAEYGRFGGGVINVTTKSGTNNIHGTVFEFLRNSALDANDYFNARAGKPIPQFKMNQFGFAVGGPVYLPRIYHGRDKTFFFVDYQGTRRIKGATFRTTVPTDAERQGDFSGLHNSKGAPIAIYDPFSTAPDPDKPGHYTRTAFQDNKIPEGMLDPVALKLMSYYPEPNTPGDPNSGVNNYISNAPLRVNQNNGSIRIDQNVNQHYHFFSRFGWLLTDLTQPNTFGNVSSGGAGAVGTTKFHSWSLAFDNTVTINPTLLLTINYGYARWYQARTTLSYGFDSSSLGFPDSFVSSITIPMFPSIGVAGYGAMNGQSYLINGNDSHSLLTSLTKIYGRQTFIMGTDVRLHFINFFNVNSSAGRFNFAKAQTQGPDPNKASATAGDAMASLLLGVGSGGNMPISSGNELKDWYSAAYIQDNIRVTNNLTVNIGLRYEEESPYTDRHNELNYFSRGVQSPAANPTFPRLKGGLVFAGVNGNSSSVYDWNTFQFGPRAGFSYNPFHSTVVRAGAGVVYAPLEISNNAVGFSPNVGFSASTGWEATTNGGLVPQNLLSNPYPQGLVQPAGSSLGAGTSLGQSLNVWDPHPDTPQSYQWNFGIQQQLPADFLVEAAYVASRGLHLAHNFNINTLDPKYLSMGTDLQTEVANPFQPYVDIGVLSQPTVTQQQLLLPFPQFTGISVENMTWGGSNYQSAQFKVKKRASHGVSLLAAYTISKWMSNIPSQDANIGPTNNTGVQTFYDLDAEKSLSENDIPQSLVLNAVVDLPFGQGRALLSNAHGIVEKLIGGWKASGILTEQKGQPLVFTAPIKDGGNRPNWVPGVSPTLPSSRSNADKVGEWFNIDAFSIPDPFNLGNVSRTTGAVRGPGIQNLDFSLAKETQLMERLHMQFRAEAFNLTNTPHFELPNTALNSNTFGEITRVRRTSPPPREIQFAVKLTF